MIIDDRFAVALKHFEKALARLDEALQLDETDIVRDALIQRFEFTFEAAWKAVYRWLRAHSIDVDEAAYAVIPEAFKNRLIVEENPWGEMRKFRNLTSHTYDEKVAIQVAAFVRAHASRLFAALAVTLRERAG